MIFACLVVQTGASLTADLLAPFYPNENNRVGYWDIRGSAVAYEDTVMLVPPIQHHKGCIWSTLPIPYGEWSINFQFKIAEGSGGGGFGIWLIDAHGADGDFYGGPSIFNGLVLIGSVFTNNTGDKFLKLKLIQSKKFEKHEENDDADYTMNLSIPVFDIDFHITPDRVEVSLSNSVVINTSLSTDLSKAWLGVTAMCDDYTSRIDILHAKFAVLEYMQMRHADSMRQQHADKRSSHTEPIARPVLRNPSFGIMKREILEYRESGGKLHGNRTVQHVMNTCTEFAEVLEDVATYTQLNNFVVKTLVPYARGWQKRTFKIIESVDNAKRILSDALNQTSALINVFNTTIRETVIRADRKIARLENLLEELEPYDSVEMEQPRIANAMKLFAVAEVSVVIIFFILHKARMNLEE